MATQEVVSNFLVNILLAILAIIVASPARAENIPVLNTNDSGDDSFRAAILASNLSPGVMDTISFAIPGPPPHLIILESELPIISDPVVIDGYSMQADAHPNTLEEGSDAVLTVGISGEMGGDNGVEQGLIITGGNTTVRGLVVINFDTVPIGMQTEGNNTIAGNYVGVNFDGNSAATADYSLGIVVASAGNVIGGAAPGDRNVITGGQRGVWVLSSGNEISGNHIGLSADGSMVVTAPYGFGVGIFVGYTDLIVGTTIGGFGRGNRIGGADVGIFVDSSVATTIHGNIIGPSDQSGNGIGISIGSQATGSAIGGLVAGEGNEVAHSRFEGIKITGSSAVAHSIRRNSIHHNQRLGIDLQGLEGQNEGVTENDEDDPDTNGANALQNFPILTDAIRTETEIQVSVTFNSLPNQDFVLEFFSNTVPEPLDGLRHNHGEGEFYLGDHSVMTDGGGDVPPFNVSLPLAAGWCISATATHLETGNTSEFSPCFPIIGDECDVTSTANSGPNTLRQGILDCANTPESGTLNRVNLIAAGPYVLEDPPPTAEGPVLLKGNGQDVMGSEGMVLTMGFGGLVFAQDINFHGPPGIPGGPGVAFVGDDSQLVGGTHSGNPVILSGPTGEVDGIVVQDAELLSLGPSAWEHAGNRASAIRINADGAFIWQGNGNSIIDSNIDASGSLSPPGSETGDVNNGPGGPFGVLVIAGTGNSSERTTYANTTVPFDLAPPGNNPNDSGDGDEGPNMLNNTPELVSAPPRAPQGAPGATATRVQGTLDSTPGTAFVIEVFVNNSGCSAGAFGAAGVFLGAFDVETNVDGIANFDETLDAETSPGDFILATATDPWGNTSEFSACALAEQVVPALLKDGFE